METPEKRFTSPLPNWCVVYVHGGVDMKIADKIAHMLWGGRSYVYWLWYVPLDGSSK